MHDPRLPYFDMDGTSPSPRMVPQIRVALVAALLAACFPLPAVARTKPGPCPPGTFALDAAAAASLGQLLGSDASTLDVSAAGDVRLGECAALGRLKAKRKTTTIAADWTSCGPATKVRVRATQRSPACTTVRGVVRAKKAKRIRFTATRLPATTTTTTIVDGTTTTTLAGATTTSTTTPGGSTTTTTLPPPPAGCGNGVHDLGEPCEGLSGCDAGEVCTSACSCALVSEPPSTSQALLAAALASGAIDYPTSLLYRALALFGDSALPPAYDGETWQGQDATLFLEIAHAWGGLSPELQAQLRPFVTRPTEPGSYYHPSETPGFAAAADDEEGAVECPFAPGAGTPDWRFTESEHFVVWSCGMGDPESDVDADKRTYAAGVAEEVYAAMVPETGPPKPDSLASGPAPQNRIDVYIVPRRICKRRGGACAPIPVANNGRPVLAAVATAPPCGAGPAGVLTASSYMILDRDRIGPPPASGPWAFRYTFAHEFFHVIANALNLQGQGGGCMDGAPQENVASWLVEASAEWAAWAYFPADGPDDREALFRGFQQRPGWTTSLRSLAGLHPYQAYLYPFFVQDETSRTDFLELWTGGAGARTPLELDDTLNQILPFAERFRDFAVRNFNTTAAELPGDPLPLAQRHQGLDPALPENVKPVVVQPQVTLVAPTTFARAAGMQPLAAQYEHYALEAGTRWAKLDFQTLANSGFVQADVIVNVAGTWERRRLPGLVFEFCRDDPGDDISEFYLVLSSHDRRPGVQVSGTYDVETRAVCPSGWTGWIKYVNTIREFDRDVGPSGTEIDEDDAVETQEWTFASTMPADGASRPWDVVELAWRGRYDKYRLFRYFPALGCLSATLASRTQATGSGSGTDRMEMRLANGLWYLAPEITLPLPQILGTTRYYFYNCGGTSGESEEALPLHNDQFSTITTAVPQFYGLEPDPNDPNWFHGTYNLLHFENDEPDDYDLVDVTVTWDIRRR